MDTGYLKSRIHQIMENRIAMGAGEGMYGESLYGQGYRHKRKHTRGGDEGGYRRKHTRGGSEGGYRRKHTRGGDEGGYRRKRTRGGDEGGYRRKRTRGGDEGGYRRKRRGGVVVGAAHNPWISFLREYRMEHPHLTVAEAAHKASKVYGR
jgi:hypothetical protein